MRRLLIALAAICALLTAWSAANAMPPLPKPKLLAVYFWAATCPNCKVLTPVLEQARESGKLDSKPVLFVTLDLTSAASIRQSVMHASALGIGPYVQGQGSATGYVALLDADSKREIKRFDRTDSVAAITQGMDAALATPAQ